MSGNTSSSILADILRENTNLVIEHEKAVSRIDARTSDGQDIGTQMDQVQKEIEEVAKIKDEQRRAVRMRVLTTNLEQLRADASKEEEDLAKAVFGLNAIIEKLGAAYNKMGELNSEEKQLIQLAETRLADAKRELEEAGQKWFFKAAAITATKSEVERAELAVSDSKSEANSRARKRLLSASFEESLQELQLRTSKAIKILEGRRAELENQLNVVGIRKITAFQVKEEAAQALNNLDQQLNDKEAELKNEEERLPGLENGSPEHAAQTAKISALKKAVEDLRGKRNAALVLFQSKEKFSKELETHEQVHQRLKDNVVMWITSLRSDTEERVVTFRSRLEAQKGLSDVNVAQELDKVTSAVDQRNLEFMVAAAGAADRLRMEKLEKHPERIKDVEAAKAAFAENIALIRKREEAMVEYFRKNYGIDPTESSFFHYTNDGGNTSTPA